MKKLLAFLILHLLSSPLWAQRFDAYLFNRIRPVDSIERQLSFNFNNFNYVRNYEYSNNFHDGYTLYGTQLEPQLVYYAHPNLAVTLGAYLRKDFGREGIKDAKPLFSLKYHKNSHTLIFGSLEGNIQHQYIEPIFNFEQKITNPIEYGTQYLVEKAGFRLDSWISWQRMIYRGDAQKEEIVGGISAKLKLFESGYWRAEIPLQFLAYHQGGQIDVLKQIPISTLANAAGGFTITKEIGRNVKSFVSENYLTMYKDFSPTKLRAYQGGFGIWMMTGFTTKWGNLLASYWYGNRFITIKGMPLYQSVSENLYENGFKQQKRNLLGLRYTYQQELLPKLYLDVRFEPHIDLNSQAKNLQFNHSFFISYRDELKIFRVRK